MSLMEKSTDDEKCPNRKKQGTVTPALRLSKEVVGCIPEIVPRFDATYRFVTCRTLTSAPTRTRTTRFPRFRAISCQVSLAPAAINILSHSAAHYVKPTWRSCMHTMSPPAHSIQLPASQSFGFNVQMIKLTQFLVNKEQRLCNVMACGVANCLNSPLQ